MRFLLNEKIIKFFKRLQEKHDAFSIITEKAVNPRAVDLRACLFWHDCKYLSFRGANVSCDRRGRREAAGWDTALFDSV